MKKQPSEKIEYLFDRVFDEMFKKAMKKFNVIDKSNTLTSEELNFIRGAVIETIQRSMRTANGYHSDKEYKKSIDNHVKVLRKALFKIETWAGEGVI